MALLIFSSAHIHRPDSYRFSLLLSKFVSPSDLFIGICGLEMEMEPKKFAKLLEKIEAEADQCLLARTQVFETRKLFLFVLQIHIFVRSISHIFLSSIRACNDRWWRTTRREMQIERL